jgi:hypothetical protein
MPAARRWRFVAVLVSGLVASSLLGACSKNAGNSSSSTASTTVSASASGDPADYVTSVCMAVATWAQSIKQRGSDFQSSQVGVTDLSVVRQHFIDFLNGLASDTETLIASVQALGPPPVSNGAAEEAAIVAALRAGAESYRDAANQAQSLSTTSPGAFSAGVTRIATAIEKSGKSTAQAIEDIKDPVLDPLFKSDTNCNVAP